MLAELTIYPIGVGTQTSSVLANLLEIVEVSKLPYVLTPSGTCVEGDWDEVMAVVKKCHEKVRSQCAHVITELRIEDDAGMSVASVKAAAARSHQNNLAPEPRKTKGEVDEIC